MLNRRANLILNLLLLIIDHLHHQTSTPLPCPFLLSDELLIPFKWWFTPNRTRRYNSLASLLSISPFFDISSKLPLYHFLVVTGLYITGFICARFFCKSEFLSLVLKMTIGLCTFYIIFTCFLYCITTQINIPRACVAL